MARSAKASGTSICQTIGNVADPNQTWKACDSCVERLRTGACSEALWIGMHTVCTFMANFLGVLWRSCDASMTESSATCSRKATQPCSQNQQRMAGQSHRDRANQNPNQIVANGNGALRRGPEADIRW